MDVNSKVSLCCRVGFVSLKQLQSDEEEEEEENKNRQLVMTLGDGVLAPVASFGIIYFSVVNHYVSVLYHAMQH